MLQHPPRLPSSPTPPIFPHNSECKRHGCRELNKPYFQVDFPKVCFQKSIECVLWPDSAHKVARDCISVWSVWQEDFYTGCVLLLLLTEGFLSLPLLAAVFWADHIWNMCPCLTHCVIFCHVTVCVCVCFRWLCRLDMNLMQQCFVL